MDEAFIELKKNYELLPKENIDLKTKLNNCVELSKRKRKSYFDSSKRNQKLIKKEHLETSKKINSYFSDYNLGISLIHLRKISPNEDGNINIEYFDESDDLTNNEASIDACVLAKDLYNISDFTYTELTKMLKLNLKSLHLVKKRINDLNKIFKISITEYGVHVDPIEKLVYTLNMISKKIPNLSTFKIKFCADSTNIGRNLKLLNFNFAVLNEKISKTAAGHYTLGVFPINKENYDETKICLSELFSSIENLNEINNIKIEKFVGGDWKFLSNFAGINSASSNYPCIWCTCDKENFFNSSLKWSIRNKEHGARNHYDAQQKYVLKNVNDRKGYINSSISLSIPFDHLIIDMLHLFLRISDTLLALFFKDLKLLELKLSGYPKGNLEVEKTKVISKLYNFLNEKCGIKNPIYIKEKEFFLKDLRGPQKLKIFSKINFLSIFPEYLDSKNVQNIWDKFFFIYNSIKDNLLSSKEIEIETKKWLENFLSLYHRNHITPYIHAFTVHLHEFVELYGDINSFNQQGHEKLNDLTTSQYFKSTNKKISNQNNFLVQLVNKKNRIDYFNLNK